MIGVNISYIVEGIVPVIQYGCGVMSPVLQKLTQCPWLYYVCMVVNWKA
jgi:hypothetical protein